MDTDMKVMAAIHDFANQYGEYPNRVVMGCNLVDELRRRFMAEVVPIKELDKIVEAQNMGIRCEYDGIPIEVDYDNPDRLEVGWMTKWIE